MNDVLIPPPHPPPPPQAALTDLENEETRIFGGFVNHAVSKNKKEQFRV